MLGQGRAVLSRAAGSTWAPWALRVCSGYGVSRGHSWRAEQQGPLAAGPAGLTWGWTSARLTRCKEGCSCPWTRGASGTEAWPRGGPRCCAETPSPLAGQDSLCWRFLMEQNVTL